MDTCNKIKAYMKARGISQTYVSERTGITTDKLNLTLNGKRRLTVDEYERICWALGVGVGEFIEPRAPDQA